MILLHSLFQFMDFFSSRYSFVVSVGHVCFFGGKYFDIFLVLVLILFFLFNHSFLHFIGLSLFYIPKSFLYIHYY